MSVETDLRSRADNQCELCAAKEALTTYAVPKAPTGGLDGHVLLCATCQTQVSDSDKVDPNHWRCLNDSMWSAIPAVQVMAWRMLHRLRGEGWPQDLLDMMYIEPKTLQWAKETELMEGETAIIHEDANGHILTAGDTVVLIKDLTVKGANFTAKRGTAVRRISLDADNANHIEGKVEGQHIVILTQYVKRVKSDK